MKVDTELWTARHIPDRDVIASSGPISYGERLKLAKQLLANPENYGDGKAVRKVQNTVRRLEDWFRTKPDVAEWKGGRLTKVEHGWADENGNELESAEQLARAIPEDLRDWPFPLAYNLWLTADQLRVLGRAGGAYHPFQRATHRKHKAHTDPVAARLCAELRSQYGIDVAAVPSEPYQKRERKWFKEKGRKGKRKRT